MKKIDPRGFRKPLLVSLLMAVWLLLLSSLPVESGEKDELIRLRDDQSPPTSSSDILETGARFVVDDEGGPSIVYVQTCDSVRGYRDYQPNLLHEFRRGLFNRAFIYAELSDLVSEQIGEDRFRYSVTVSARITNEEGRTIFSRDRAFALRDTASFPVTDIWLYVFAPTIFLPRGEYLLEAVIVDDISLGESHLYTYINII